MLLLHLSDLHFGNKNRFSDDEPRDLGKAFYRALNVARQELSSASENISLVIVTGDLAESGLPSEFHEAREFFDALASEMGIERTHFVFLPGNHDISWNDCQIVRAGLRGEKFPSAEFGPRLDTEKLRNFHDFLSSFYGLVGDHGDLSSLDNTTALSRGAWLREFPELQISVAALNTSERENDETKGGFLGAEQAQALMNRWLENGSSSFLKIVALHHNPLSTTAANKTWTEEWLRRQETQKGTPVPMPFETFKHYIDDLTGFDGKELLTRIVKDTAAHLVLHGHHHDQGDPVQWPWAKDGNAPVLSVGSLGLTGDQLPGDAPLSCQLIQIITPLDSAIARLVATPLVYDGRFRIEGQVLAGGFRVETRSRAAYDQPLTLPIGWLRSEPLDIGLQGENAPAIDESQDPIPAPPVFYAEPPYIGSHEFVGRVAQLETLDEWGAPASPHSLLLFEAIGGTGKSMLTWHWTKYHAPSLRSDWAGTFWYSFYERGAMMADFCRRALAYMTGRPFGQFKKQKTDELGKQLLHQLQSRPWLLVLDGLERVLVSYHRYDAAQANDEEAGATDHIAKRDPCASIRPEDDDLLRALAGASPSKLLLTTRLTPRILLNSANQPIIGVRREALPGLRPVDAEALLRACGVTGNSQAIQDYLQRHCDCHPLVTGVLGGLIINYLPDRGNFDAWAIADEAGEGVNYADLNLVQKRTHILKTALESLSDKHRQLLSTISLLSKAADFTTISALNPYLPPRPEVILLAPPPEVQDKNSTADDNTKETETHYELAVSEVIVEDGIQLYVESPEFNAAVAKLTDAVHNLESRGLLQYDHQSKRYDLHPVVRAVTSGMLKQTEKDVYGQRMVDHFSQQAHSPYDEAETIADVETGLHLVRTLLKMGRYQHACDAFVGELCDSLQFNLENYAEVLALLRPFFPEGWLTLPTVVDDYNAHRLANDAAGALVMIQQDEMALQIFEATLPGTLQSGEFFGAAINLNNIAVALDEGNHLAAGERCALIADEMSMALGIDEYIFCARLNRFIQLSGLGKYEEADSMWQMVNPMGRNWPRALYRPGSAETAYAIHRFRVGTLEEEHLSLAETLARTGKNRQDLRSVLGLRGAWHLRKGRWALAAAELRESVRMAREVEQPSAANESRLAFAKLHLNQLPQPLEEVERLEQFKKPHFLMLARLCLAIANREDSQRLADAYRHRSQRHALAAYKDAWADGEPYVIRYALNEATALLEQLGCATPKLPPHDEAKNIKRPWEDLVLQAIADLREQRKLRVAKQATENLVETTEIDSGQNRVDKP